MTVDWLPRRRLPTPSERALGLRWVQSETATSEGIAAFQWGEARFTRNYFAGTAEVRICVYGQERAFRGPMALACVDVIAGLAIGLLYGGGHVGPAWSGPSEPVPDNVIPLRPR